MEIKISRPDGYDYGAFIIKATLSNEEKEALKMWPAAFKIPNLKNRLIHTSPEYSVVVTNESETEINGQFVNGQWLSHLYSNGVEEDTNPTSVKTVKEAISKSMKNSIKVSVEANQRWKTKNA